MPDVNEEDYLDNLLKSMSDNQMPDEKREASSDEIEERKIKEQVEEALSKSNDIDEHVNAFDDDEVEENQTDIQSEEFDWEKEKESLQDLNLEEDSPSVTPEDIAKMAMEHSNENSDIDIEEKDLFDDDVQLNDEDLDANINKMLEDTDLADVSSIALDDTDDAAQESLSPSELERLVNMNLDDIIDDATSDSVSVDDLFGDSSKKENVSDEIQLDSENDDSMKEDASPDIDQQQSELNTPENMQETDEISAAEALGIHPDGSNHAIEKPVKEKKIKKPKKSLLSIIKNIFFESIEEENLENEELTENSSSIIKDENEKLIDEVYGGKEHVDEESVPQKGFFAKLKYRLKQRKLKNEEENRLELEAEEADDLERKKQKEEKKIAAKENKENKKKEKAAKPKKEKKPKAKKEKKPKKEKEPPKPGDILKIKPISMVFFILLVAGIIVLIQVMNMSMQKGNGVSKAKAYYANGDYMKAYDSLSGLTLNKSEKTLYEQSSTLMYVQRQYDSYENYMKINLKTEALNALIKGLDRYNTYYNEAKNLGVSNQMDAIKKSILDALQSTFKVSEAEASSLVSMMENDFTKYYTTIEAYGEALK